jgi:hypothetical protein
MDSSVKKILTEEQKNALKLCYHMTKEYCKHPKAVEAFQILKQIQKDYYENGIEYEDVIYPCPKFETIEDCLGK